MSGAAAATEGGVYRAINLRMKEALKADPAGAITLTQAELVALVAEIRGWPPDGPVDMPVVYDGRRYAETVGRVLAIWSESGLRWDDMTPDIREPFLDLGSQIVKALHDEGAFKHR